MNAIANTIIAFFELAEAEGRLLEEKVVRTAYRLLLMVTAFVLMVIFFVSVLAAVFYGLEPYLAVNIRFLVVGSIALACGGALLWIAIYKDRRPLTRPNASLETLAPR